ncbi:MAG: Nif3-like dinuclear metal center hexameric protein [Candidatus Nanopelagicales bacterium]
MSERPATVADVVAAVHRRYDPAWAEPWDAVGLVCGDPAAPVRRIHLAVDPTLEVVEEALDSGADLLLTHHPLLLRPVSSVAATDPGGRVVHALIRGGCALLAAHTNADVARDGVSDALAALLGLLDVRPVRPSAPAGPTGLGRIGLLDAGTTLGEYAAVVDAALPATAHGVRISGDPARTVERVAVCGGSGSDLLAEAGELGADVLVTADLKHHVALDNLAAGGPAVLDVSHWASERPWLDAVAPLLVSDLAADGVTVDTHVSGIVTDPWSARL